jgi:2'-5' RNA ligase
MRIFVALDIDEEIRRRIARFVEGLSGFAPEARWVLPESLHITLKFVGEKPPELVEEMKNILAGISVAPFEVSFRGYGFFPTPKSARVFWIGIEAGWALTRLAGQIDAALATCGIDIDKEEHEYRPHLTLARGGGKSGSPHRQKGDQSNTNFQELQRRLSRMATPDFGTMTARAFFIYQSRLGRGGSTYTKLVEFGLR